MSFCPRCGAPTTPSMSFCTSCGESLAPGIQQPGAPVAPMAQGTAAPPTMATPLGPGAAPRGPVGKVMEPWLPLVLTLVTFGIYMIFFALRTSREIDEYRMTPGHARKPILVALWLMLAAIVLAFVAFASFFSSVDFSDPEAGPSFPGAASAGLSFFLFFAAAVAATIFYYVGQWRVWSGIEAEERAKAHPKPLSPGLQLVFVLVPYLNIVTMWIAIYRTQDHLNGLWTGRTS